jgi:hypothetical protein
VQSPSRHNTCEPKNLSTSMRQCPPSLPFCLLFGPCLSPILLVSPHRKRQSSVRHMSDDSRALLKVSAPTSVMQLSESQRTLRRGANLWVMKASVSTCRQPAPCHVSCVLFTCSFFPCVRAVSCVILSLHQTAYSMTLVLIVIIA